MHCARVFTRLGIGRAGAAKGCWERDLSRSTQAELKWLAMEWNRKELKGSQGVTNGFWEKRGEEGQSASCEGQRAGETERVGERERSLAIGS